MRISKYVEVHNLNGTSDNDPAPYDSWKDFWEEYKGPFGKCSRIHCNNDAEYGCHVQKYQSSDRKWYIVPLCAGHNNSHEVFAVREDDLLAVSEK